MPTERDPLLTVTSPQQQEEEEEEEEEEKDDAQGVLAAIVEGATNLVEGATDTLQTVQENVLEEMNQVHGAFVEETKDDNESSYFLEMSMARTWSILPCDIEHVTEAVDQVLGMPEKDKNITLGVTETPKVPLHAYFLLALAVVSLSSIGPMLDLQQGCSPTTKIYWRMSGTAMFLFPLCCIDLYREGLPKLTLAQATTFCLAAACYAVMTNGFVLALDYTSVGNAVILANCQAILFLIGRALVGEHITLLEGSGASTAFLGAVLCSRDQSGDGDDDSGESGSFAGLYGDFLALIAGIGGAWYLLFAKAARSHVSLYTFMFLVMAVGSTFTLLFQMFILEEHVTFDRNIRHGVWGWMNTEADRMPLEVSMVLICNLMGSVGYIRAMQHFDPLVVSTAGLMEPVIATLMVFALGIGILPGWLGWIGNLLVAIGTLAVIYPTNGQKKKEVSH